MNVICILFMLLECGSLLCGPVVTLRQQTGWSVTGRWITLHGHNILLITISCCGPRSRAVDEDPIPKCWPLSEFLQVTCKQDLAGLVVTDLEILITVDSLV